MNAFRSQRPSIPLWYPMQSLLSDLQSSFSFLADLSPSAPALFREAMPCVYRSFLTLAMVHPATETMPIDVFRSYGFAKPICFPLVNLWPSGDTESATTRAYVHFVHSSREGPFAKSRRRKRYADIVTAPNRVLLCVSISDETYKEIIRRSCSIFSQITLIDGAAIFSAVKLSS